jgi:hypothetical protein
MDLLGNVSLDKPLNYGARQISRRSKERQLLLVDKPK